MTHNDSTQPTGSDPIRRGLVWRVLQLALELVFWLWLRLAVRGVERIDADTGGLILANHQSFLDPMLVGVKLQRPVSFLARDSLFRVFLIGRLLKKTHVLPINRRLGSASSIRIAASRIESGCLVGLFPEGTRTRDGQTGEFKAGFIAVLRRAQCPVYPVGISGAFQALPPGAILPRFAKVRVVFGVPILYEELYPCLGKGQESDAVNLLRERILDCQREAEDWCNEGSKTDNSEQASVKTGGIRRDGGGPDHT